MASIVYKKVGDKVESKLVDIKYLAQELEHGGWSTDESGITKELIDKADTIAPSLEVGETVVIQEATETEEAITITRTEADTNNTGKLSVKEVRAAAEEAGIEDFATARIATLKAKLWPTQK
ncbi:MAG: hypothetical protein JKY50_22735 [Oleispira sp.]|nr:hypothetical protein [Oleispira sp.]